MSEGTYEKLILGPRYAVQLRDLEDHHLVRINCFMCRHSSTVPPSMLAERWQPYTRLMELESYMVCRQCGNRMANHWEIVVEQHETR